MKLVTVLGIIAAVCTTSSFVPQVIKTIEMKDTKGISLLMYSIFKLGVLLWLIYGLINGDLPVILANAAPSRSHRSSSS
jgi:MtN3 and saliva related transmembrane protein